MINPSIQSRARSWLQNRYYVAAVLISFILFVSLYSRSGPTPTNHGVDVYRDQTLITPRELATNSTLGFEKIVALSMGDNWRTRGLHAAAKLTGLEITIPHQPHNPEELIRAFEKIGSDRGAKLPQHGSATAWLAHLDLLKFVIASGYETTLIVEDDVDWDVEIKSQTPLISDNVRAYLNTPEHDLTPYGTDWDILWLGHCGSAIDKGVTQERRFEDPTRCKTDLYSGWSKHFLRDFLPDPFRNVQSSTMTVCTFGFAVTKQSAQKVLKLAARGADEAYDVSLSHLCRDGHLKCVVINPQIMNHYEPPPDHGYLSPVHVGDGQQNNAEKSDFEFFKGTTGNIMKSARCKALFNDVCMRPPSEM